MGYMDCSEKWIAFNNFAQYIDSIYESATVKDTFEWVGVAPNFDWNDPDNFDGRWDFDIGAYGFRVHYLRGRFLLDTEDGIFNVDFRQEEPTELLIEVFKIIGLTLECMCSLNNQEEA